MGSERLCRVDCDFGGCKIGFVEIRGRHVYGECECPWGVNG